MERFIARVASAALVLALAACGGGEPEEGAADGAMSIEEAAEEMDQAVQLRPGQYETSVEVLEFSIPGMPEAQAAQMREMMAGRQAAATSFCLTPEEAGQGPEQMVQEMAAADCAFDRLDVSGGSISAEMRCTAEGGIEGRYALEGEMTAESSTMTMQIDQAAPGMPGEGRMEMSMRVASQRIGECG